MQKALLPFLAMLCFILFASAHAGSYHDLGEPIAESDIPKEHRGGHKVGPITCTQENGAVFAATTYLAFSEDRYLKTHEIYLNGELRVITARTKKYSAEEDPRARLQKDLVIFALNEDSGEWVLFKEGLFGHKTWNTITLGVIEDIFRMMGYSDKRKHALQCESAVEEHKKETSEAIKNYYRSH